MNLSDGGKNRQPMRKIDMLGARSVLDLLEEWDPSIKLADARRKLMAWGEVRGQFTSLESVFFEVDMIMVYNAKYMPELQAIEKIWRAIKVILRHEHVYPFAEAVKQFNELFASNEMSLKCEKYFKLVR